MLKTSEEIRERLKENLDMFGHQASVLVEFLDFESVKDLLKPDYVKSVEDGKEKFVYLEPKKEIIIKEMSTYMEDYGWPKARDHRGLSAGRTIEKMKAWLWLLGDTKMYDFADDDDNFPQYGAPILKEICEEYKFTIPVDKALFNMTQKNPCIDDCPMGCGHE